jgi:hypothetical protein
VKTSVTLTIIVLSFSLVSQIEKGAFLLTGNVSYSYSENSYPDTNMFSGKESSFTFAPKVGYFIHDNWAVGAGVQMNFGQKMSLNSTVPSIFGRYYAMRKEHFLFFFEANSRFQKRNNTFLNFGASLGLGSSIFITPKISFDAQIGILGYNYTRTGVPENGVIFKNFGFNAGQFQADRLRLGFTYYF